MWVKETRAPNKFGFQQVSLCLQAASSKQVVPANTQDLLVCCGMIMMRMYSMMLVYVLL
jgi:hypothetical protein